MKKSLVSVIIPSYNYEDYIGESIESVLNQDYQGEIEIVIVDDGSTDQSPEIIEEYARNHSNIKPVFHKKNKGIPYTFNTGLDKSEGEYIGILSSDDIWFESKVSKQIEAIKKSNKKVIWSEGMLIDDRSQSMGATFSEAHNALEKKKSGDLFTELLCRNFIFGSSLLFHKEVVSNLRFCTNLKYLNDYLFFVQVAEDYDFEYLTEPLAGYRRHGTNATEDFAEDIEYYRDRVAVREYFLDKYTNMSDKMRGYQHYKLSKYYSKNLREKGKSVKHLKYSIQTDKRQIFNIDVVIYLLLYDFPRIRRILSKFRQKIL
jgi:glycosyltransferase involved in cell wall biosynthesis